MEKTILKEKVKSFFVKHMAALLVSIACVSFLVALFITWQREQENLSKSSFNAAVLSATLFSVVGIIFIFKWFNDYRCAYRNIDIPKETEDEGRYLSDRMNVLLIFVWLTLVSIAVLLLVWLLQCVHGNNISFADSLNVWKMLDSQHYLHIADNWYAFEGLKNETLANDVRIVFFPGYPVFVRFIKLLSLNFADTFSAAMFASINLFAGSGCMLYKLMRIDYSKATAIRSVKFLCLIPGAFFFIAPMSESLFLFVTISAVYFTRKGNYFLAALFGFYAAFTRSLGILILVPIVYELILRTVKEKPTGIALLKRIGEFCTTLIVPCGFLLYLFLNYKITGDAFMFLSVQKSHWGQEISYFFNTASYQTKWFTEYIKGGNTQVAYALWGMGLLALFGTLALLIAGARRMRSSYLGYSIVYYAIAMGATWLLSAPRYAVGMFSLPIALSLITKNKIIQEIITVFLVVIYVIYATMFMKRWQVW